MSTSAAQLPNQNRKRMTLKNLFSKQYLWGALGGRASGGLPALDPAAVANYFGQIQSLQRQLRTELASIRQQRVGLRGEAKVARADVESQAFSAMRETIAGAMERGVLGSSAELIQRAEVRAQSARGIADINRQLYDKLAELQQVKTRVGIAAEQGVQQIIAGATAQRMQLAAQERANAIAIQAARMQAEASRMIAAAQTEAARKQLAWQKEQAAIYQALAANPQGVPTGGFILPTKQVQEQLSSWGMAPAMLKQIMTFGVHPETLKNLWMIHGATPPTTFGSPRTQQLTFM